MLSFSDRKQSKNTVCAVCAGCLIPVDSWLVAVSRPLCNTVGGQLVLNKLKVRIWLNSFFRKIMNVSIKRKANIVAKSDANK